MQFDAAPAGAEPERKPFSGGIMADGARVRRLTVHRDAGGFDCAEEFERERFRGFELDCRRSRRKAEPGIAERRPAPAGDAQRRVASGQDGAPVQRKPDDGGAAGDIACPDRKFVVIEKSGAEQFFKFAGRFAERVAQQELPVKRGRTVLSPLLPGRTYLQSAHCGYASSIRARKTRSAPGQNSRYIRSRAGEWIMPTIPLAESWESSHRVALT